MGIIKSQLGIAIGQVQSPLDLAEQRAPTATNKKVRLYSKSVGGSAEFFVLDDLGNEIRVTNGGTINNGIRDQIVVDENGVVQKITPGIAGISAGPPGSYAITLNTPITIHGSGPYLYTCDEHLDLTVINSGMGGPLIPPTIGSIEIINPGNINMSIWIWNGTGFDPAMLPWTFAIFIDP